MGQAPILFSCAWSTGLIDSSLLVAGELARQGAAELWFAIDENGGEEAEARAVSMREADRTSTGSSRP